MSLFPYLLLGHYSTHSDPYKNIPGLHPLHEDDDPESQVWQSEWHSAQVLFKKKNKKLSLSQYPAGQSV